MRTAGFWMAGLSVLVLSSVPAFAKNKAAAVTVTQGWVRAVPSTSPNSAAYFKITNDSGKTLRLVGGHSAVARAVEVHEHMMKGMMAQMKKLDGLEIAPHQSQTLKPMGYHLMLIGLKKSFFAKKTVSIALVFSDGSEKQITLPVRGPNQH